MFRYKLKKSRLKKTRLLNNGSNEGYPKATFLVNQTFKPKTGKVKICRTKKITSGLRTLLYVFDRGSYLVCCPTFFGRSHPSV